MDWFLTLTFCFGSCTLYSIQQFIGNLFEVLNFIQSVRPLILFYFLLWFLILQMNLLLLLYLVLCFGYCKLSLVCALDVLFSTWISLYFTYSVQYIFDALSAFPSHDIGLASEIMYGSSTYYIRSDTSYTRSYTSYVKCHSRLIQEA